MASAARSGFATLAVGNLGGKALAIAREVAFASAFGASSVAAAMRVAQAITMAPSQLLASDIIPGAFAPAYSSHVSSGRLGAARRLLAGSLTVVGGLSALATLVVSVSADFLVDLVAPGLSDKTSVLAVALLRILAFCLPLFLLSAVLNLALACRGSYRTQSLRPVIQSVGLLLGTGAAVMFESAIWLAWGYLAAWIVYTFASVLASVRHQCFTGTDPVKSATPKANRSASPWRTLLPLLPLPVLVQTGVISERAIASLGGDQLVAAIDYARLFSETAISLVGVPLALLGLTRLANLDTSDFQRAVGRMVAGATWMVVPIATILMLFGKDLVRFAFQRGSFSSDDTAVVSSVLVGLASLLYFQVLGYSLARAAIARRRTPQVVYATIVALLCQISVQLLSVEGLGPFAIGLGPSIFGLVLSVWLATALGLRSVVLRHGATVGTLAACLAAIGSVSGRLDLQSLVVGVVAAALAISRPTRESIVDELLMPVLRRIRRQETRG